MGSKADSLRLGDEAVTLRRAGRSRREIRAILGVGNDRLAEALKGEPPPAWTRRPRAKDDLREEARNLRTKGLSYNQIASKLGVSKSSVSLWVRDLPRPETLSDAAAGKPTTDGLRRYWAQERRLREAWREALRMAAAAEIGNLSDREILIAGAIAYWCEGSKNKPYMRADRVTFVNSDPALIRFFLRFLQVAGVAPEQLTFRVHIHELADAEAAQRFWADVTEAEASQFRRPTIKRHNPKTVRKNIGGDYHGCLCVRVRQCAELYQKIEGWARALMGDLKGTGPTGSGSEPR
jgi:hypothetical protein